MPKTSTIEENFPALPIEQCQPRPSHPGALLREIVLPASGMSPAELAERLDIWRRALSQILNETQPVTPDLANRLGRFFGNGAELWLNLQQQRDKWDILHADQAVYGLIEPLAAKEREEADLMVA